MDATVKILEELTNITGFYDKEADVLYISLGEPREAVAVDVSDGVIARYHEDSETIVGITLIGLRQRVLKELNRKLHVVPHPNGWAVTEENLASSEKVFATQEAALKYAVGLAKAQWLEVVIHGENGEVEEVINPAIDALLLRRKLRESEGGEKHECLESV
ncbi:MAG: DUF2188 domain-containing protein [Oscillatoriales cyanobacterium RU_3_3]|nr:DUF2188 domain-containing protein [Microcoleus sp. SM1_3_4]NJM63191.1 DUF2188 domain-containing protein [Oscillatoriales cyanobacterium RU_3_3]NJR20795.1 DUF2188 domain-containing protein [Richelia sp. CSU_2_1]